MQMVVRDRCVELVFIVEVLGDPAPHRERVDDPRPVGVEVEVGRESIRGKIVEAQLTRLGQLHHLGRHDGLRHAGDHSKALR